MAQATLLSYFAKQPHTAMKQQSIPLTQRKPTTEALREDQKQPSPTITTSALDARSKATISPNSGQPPAGLESNQSPPPQPTSAPHSATSSTPIPTSTTLRSTNQSEPYTLSPPLPSHVPALRQLTTTILPIPYSPKFYLEATSDPDVVDFTHVVLNHDRPVGWITCRVVRPESIHAGNLRLLEGEEGLSGNQIYIRALCILAPHREQGLASRLLRAVLNPDLLAKHKISGVFAHVWESNDTALEWYEKRGFRKVRKAAGYYKRLRPQGAWIVSREVGVCDYLPRSENT